MGRGEKGGGERGWGNGKGHQCMTMLVMEHGPSQELQGCDYFWPRFALGAYTGWMSSFLRNKKGLSVQSERPAQVDEIAWWTKLQQGTY